MRPALYTASLKSEACPVLATPSYLSVKIFQRPLGHLLFKCTPYLVDLISKGTLIWLNGPNQTDQPAMAFTCTSASLRPPASLLPPP